MKIFLIILAVLAVVALAELASYLWQRRRQQKADREGVVVYATLISAEPVLMFGRPQGISKIVLRLQEPSAAEARDATIRTRTDPSQKIQQGMRIPVVIDPTDPKRVYPASPEAAKRAVLTGSRGERRLMDSQLRKPTRGPGMRPGGGYQPPTSRMPRR